jgi:hypothetical protein
MIAAVASATVLAASPARVRFDGAGSRRLTLSDRGAAVVVTAAPARYPRATSSAVRWVAVHPRRFVLRPRRPIAVTVSARPPARARPGSYDALVLLSTVLPRKHGVAVRVRLGVHVVVRVPRRRVTAGTRGYTPNMTAPATVDPLSTSAEPASHPHSPCRDAAASGRHRSAPAAR